MAEQLTGTSECCPSEQQASCCEESEKEGCCTPAASSCGCSGLEDVREQGRARYAAAAIIRAAKPPAA